MYGPDVQASHEPKLGCDQDHACGYVSSSDIVKYKLVRHSQVNCILCMSPEGNIAHKTDTEGSLSSYNVNRLISVGIVTVIYRDKTKPRHWHSHGDLPKQNKGTSFPIAEKYKTYCSQKASNTTLPHQQPWVPSQVNQYAVWVISPRQFGSVVTSLQR